MTPLQSLKELFSPAGKSSAAFRALYHQCVIGFPPQGGFCLQIETRDALAMVTDECLDPWQAAIICWLLSRGSCRQAMSDVERRAVAKTAAKLSGRILSEASQP
jgi:hypothetical protein